MINIYVIAIKRLTDSEGKPFPLYEQHWQYLMRDSMNNCHYFKNIGVNNIDGISF